MEQILTQTGITLAIIGWIGYQLKEIPAFIWMLIRQRITVTIESRYNNYEVYEGTLNWLNETFPKLSDHASDNVDFDMYNRFRTRNEVANGVYYFMLDKITPCIVHSYTEKGVSGSGAEKWINIIIYGPHRLEWYRKYKEAVFGYLLSNSKSFTPVIMNINSTRVIIQSPKREFKSIIFKHNEELKKLIDRFLTSKNFYMEHGVLYKTGFLFYGPPGSGKSSIIRAISTYVGWPVYYISDRMPINSLHSKMIYVIEDIDCITDNREKKTNKVTKEYSYDDDDDDDTVAAHVVRADDEKRISLQLLLNLIDGIISPNEVLFIATTNYIDRVDPALRRQGRFDHAFEVNYLDRNDAEKMCEYYNHDKSVLDGMEFPVSGAVLQNKIIYDRLNG